MTARKRSNRGPAGAASSAPVTGSTAPARTSASDDTVEVEPGTEGQRLLLEVDASLTEIVAAIGGGSKQVVSTWRRGSKIPGAKNRAKLHRAFGIPPTAWERLPGEEAPEPASPSPTARLASTDERPSTLEEADSQLMLIDEQLQEPKLSPSARVRLIDSRTKVLALKARLEKDRELLEDRIIKEHPSWKRIRLVLARALEPYPDAAKAAAEALADAAEG